MPATPLSREEAEALMRSRSQSVILKRGQNIKYLPYAFTEQGVAMLSSVLRSPRAVEVNIAIMRTFVQLRRLMDSNRVLARWISKSRTPLPGRGEKLEKAGRLRAPAP